MGREDQKKKKFQDTQLVPLKDKKNGKRQIKRKKVREEGCR